MPYATNNGVRIYYEREGSGPPLVLHAGFTMSLNDWRADGYVAALRDQFSLILMDPRAHGRSDKPHDPTAHHYDARIGDILAVLDDACLAQAHLWGYSMGGRIGFGVANTAPDRFLSLIIGGAHPYPVNRAQWQQTADTLLAEAQGQPAPSLDEQGQPTDQRDPASLGASALATRDFAGATHRLAACVTPILIYCGTADPAFEQAKQSVALLPHAQFIAVPGLDHVQGWVQSGAILPHVRAFLATAS